METYMVSTSPYFGEFSAFRRSLGDGLRLPLFSVGSFKVTHPCPLSIIPNTNGDAAPQHSASIGVKQKKTSKEGYGSEGDRLTSFFFFIFFFILFFESLFFRLIQ